MGRQEVVRAMVLTKARTLEARDAIHALAGHIPGVNPIHLAIVPGAVRVPLRS